MARIAYYMRTSHYLQNISTQIDRVEPHWTVYKDEGISGRIAFNQRPAGKKLLQDIEEGRISEVKVLRIDRLGRTVSDIIQTINAIHEHRVPITSINEGITTLDEHGKQTPVTGLLINVLVSLSEFFYHQNREKALDGVSKAKALGRYEGRSKGSIEPIEKFLAKPKIKKMVELINDGVGVRKCARILECSPNLYYKTKKALEAVQV